MKLRIIDEPVPVVAQKNLLPMAHIQHQDMGLPASCDREYSKVAEFCHQRTICSWSEQPCNTRKFLLPNHEYDPTSNRLVHPTRLRIAFNWTKNILKAGKAPLDAKLQSGRTATCMQTNEEECWLSAKR
jgi:hypothetical protein